MTIKDIERIVIQSFFECICPAENEYTCPYCFRPCIINIAYDCLKGGEYH